jgi:DNA-binding XRE family transcriptional regulator
MTAIEKGSLHSVNDLLDLKYGAPGMESRAAFHEKALAWYYGEILRDRRKELKLTQQELADRTGTKRAYISRIEKGETDMQLSSFIRIAHALGLECTLT